MQKRIITDHQADSVIEPQAWLNIDSLAEVEITSEDPAYPIEAAFQYPATTGWRASQPGKQIIRLIFTDPQTLKQIRLSFLETEIIRTQEYLLRCSTDGGISYQDILRQQWNFNPQDASLQIENHQLNLTSVSVLELILIPDISGKQVIASLQLMLLA